MAFHMDIAEKFGEMCDICKKIDDSRPMLRLSTTGRRYDQRNFIWIHLDEFEKKLAKAKKPKEQAA